MVKFIKRLFGVKEKIIIDRAEIKRYLKNKSKNELINMICVMGSDIVAYKRKEK